MKNLFSAFLAGWGNSHLKDGRFDAALESLNQAIHLNPNNAAAYYRRGLIHAQLANFKEALKDFNYVLQLNPSDVEVYANRASIYLEMGNYRKVVEDCNHVLFSNPNNLFARYNRGMAYLKLNYFTAAIEDFTQAIINNPNLGDLYTNRGITSANRGDFKEEIVDFSQVLLINPSYAEAYSKRGNVRLKLKDKHGAIEDLQKAANLFLDQGDTHSYKKTVDCIKELELSSQQQQINELYEPAQNLEQMEQQLANLQQLIANLDVSRSLHSQVEKLTARLEGIEDTIASMPNQVSEAINKQVAEGNRLLEEIRPAHEYKLVSNRGESRSVLMEALEKTQERLIIVCPWLSQYGIGDDLLQKFNTLLNHSTVCIDIGWGNRKDWEEGTMGNWSHPNLGWKYSALPKLRQLEQKYSSRFRLKAMGTHEKFLVCDRTFAMLGSHNFLTSSSNRNEREVGIRTTDPRIIQDLIDRFESAPSLEVQSK